MLETAVHRCEACATIAGARRSGVKRRAAPHDLRRCADGGRHHATSCCGYGICTFRPNHCRMRHHGRGGVLSTKLGHFDALPGCRWRCGPLSCEQAAEADSRAGRYLGRLGGSKQHRARHLHGTRLSVQCNVRRRRYRRVAVHNMKPPVRQYYDCIVRGWCWAFTMRRWLGCALLATARVKPVGVVTRCSPAAPVTAKNRRAICSILQKARCALPPLRALYNLR